MGRGTTAPSFLLAFLLPILLLLVGTSSGDKAFLRSLCVDSLHHDTCVRTLLGDWRAVECASRKCVARIGVTHALVNVSDTRGEVLRMLRKGVPVVADVLRKCNAWYANAAVYLDDVLRLTDKGNYFYAESRMSMVRKEAGSCELAFPTRPSPIARMNSACADMLDIAVELLAQVNTEPPGVEPPPGDA